MDIIGILNKGKEREKQKQEEEKEKISTKGLVQLIDYTGNFLYKMGSMGGFAYVIFGSGVLIFIIMLATVKLLGETLVRSFTPILVGFLIGGYAFAIMERILAYWMASMKIKIILSLTEKLILRTIPSEGTIDTAVITRLNNEVLNVLWGMNVPEPALKQKNHLQNPDTTA